MINEILSDTKNRLTAEKQQMIAEAVLQNYNKVVLPQFASLDEKLSLAISQMQIDTQKRKDELQNSEAAKIKYQVEAQYANALKLLGECNK